MKATFHPSPSGAEQGDMIPAQPRSPQLLKHDQGSKQGESSTLPCLTAPLSPGLGVGGWIPSWEAASVFMEHQFLPTVTWVRWGC